MWLCFFFQHASVPSHCKRTCSRTCWGVPALLYKLKQKAMADCKDTAKAYAECCGARVFSAVWACRGDLGALNQCLQQQCAPRLSPYVCSALVLFSGCGPSLLRGQAWQCYEVGVQQLVAKRLCSEYASLCEELGCVGPQHGSAGAERAEA